MKKIFLITACSIAITFLQSQIDSASEKKQKIFIASVTTMDGKTLKGHLCGVSDTPLILKANGNQMRVPSENVKSFTVKRKNSAARGALIGFGIGAVAGIIIGLASGDDKSPVMRGFKSGIRKSSFEVVGIHC